MRISDWSSDVCSSDLRGDRHSFEDVLTAMLMPIIHVFSARDRMLYARFMMRLLPLDEDEHPYFKALHLCGPSVEIQRRLQYCLPHLPYDVLNTRVRMAVSIFLQIGRASCRARVCQYV